MTTFGSKMFPPQGQNAFEYHSRIRKDPLECRHRHAQPRSTQPTSAQPQPPFYDPSHTSAFISIQPATHQSLWPPRVCFLPTAALCRSRPSAGDKLRRRSSPTLRAQQRTMRCCRSSSPSRTKRCRPSPCPSSEHNRHPFGVNPAALPAQITPANSSLSASASDSAPPARSAAPRP